MQRCWFKQQRRHLPAPISARKTRILLIRRMKAEMMRTEKQKRRRVGVAANPLTEGEAGGPKRQLLSQSHQEGAEAAQRKLRVLRKLDVVEKEEDRGSDHLILDKVFLKSEVTQSCIEE
jgi:hypothetical protein